MNGTAWTRQRCAAAHDRLLGLDLAARVDWAVERFAPALALATSFGPQSIVLMHALAPHGTRVVVFFLDTGLLFPETYALRARLERRFGISIRRVTAELTLEEQWMQHGPALWARDPDACCHLRKVAPLAGFLAGHTAWITGMRRAHGHERAQRALVEWDEAHGLVKLNLLADWSTGRVWATLREHGLPTNVLHEQGYRSVGCRPCTRPVGCNEDPRAGRWAGRTKTECGIHRGGRA